MSDRSFFERKMSDLENRSFFAHFCPFALFERAKEQSLFLSLFQKAMALFIALFKRAKKEQSLIRSFAKSDEKSDCSIALLKQAN